MRPIDADAIHYCNYDLDNYHSFRAVEDDEIADMPTLTLDDIVPHGRWRGKPPLRECQCCGEIHSELGGNGGKAWDYCPSCGAKMDLEGK